MSLPAGAVSPEETEVFVALLRAWWKHDGRVTVRDVAFELRRSYDYTHRRLKRLAERGLVGYGIRGATRPLYFVARAA